MHVHKKTKILYASVRILIVLIFIAVLLESVFSKRSDADNSRNIFITIQAGFLMILTFIPWLITRTWKVEIPSVIEILFILFSVSHALLGEIGYFYARFSWWDSLLHFISGGLIAIIGFSLINLLNQNENLNIVLSPFFSAVFVICFSLAMGALWELTEFTFDFLAAGNSQRHTNIITGNAYIGQSALYDTMKDLALDLLGAIIIGVIGYFDLKHREGKNLIKKIEIIQIENKTE